MDIQKFILQVLLQIFSVFSGWVIFIILCIICYAADLSTSYYFGAAALAYVLHLIIARYAIENFPMNQQINEMLSRMSAAQQRNSQTPDNAPKTIDLTAERKDN